MDPSLALVHLTRDPPIIVAGTALLPGAVAPLHIPLAWLPPEARAQWLLARPDLPLAERVEAALAAGLEERAWDLLRRRTAPLTSDFRLEQALVRWLRARQARGDLRIDQSPLLLLPAEGRQAQIGEALTALTEVRDMLADLAWPRWIGPVVVITDGRELDGLAPGADLLARPVLPLVRLEPAAAGGASVRERLAGRLCRLALALDAPPAGGWPAWLEQGLEQVAMAKARGEGPSPRAMHAIRQRVGKEGLTRLLAGGPVDREAAGAVGAVLVHSRRRHLLPGFLDLLRNGADAHSALRIAYGLDVDRLLAER